jgi:hypothetical protein
MKILLGGYNAKLGREELFTQTIGNESLHEISNNNGVRSVNFTTSKNLSKVQCSHIVTFVNLLGHFLMERCTTELIIF